MKAKIFPARGPRSCVANLQGECGLFLGLRDYVEGSLRGLIFSLKGSLLGSAPVTLGHSPTGLKELSLWVRCQPRSVWGAATKQLGLIHLGRKGRYLCQGKFIFKKGALKRSRSASPFNTGRTELRLRRMRHIGVTWQSWHWNPTFLTLSCAFSFSWNVQLDLDFNSGLWSLVLGGVHKNRQESSLKMLVPQLHLTHWIGISEWEMNTCCCFFSRSLGRFLGRVAPEGFVVGKGSQCTGDSHPVGDMPAGFAYWTDMSPF